MKKITVVREKNCYKAFESGKPNSSVGVGQSGREAIGDLICTFRDVFDFEIEDSTSPKPAHVS